MLEWLKKAPGWAWSNLGNIVQIAAWVGAFALTAWAAKAANILSQYAPFSWVVAGFVGSFLVAAGFWLVALARARWVRTKYDNAMMLRGGLVDPMAKTFERKRIYLSEFTLPSHAWIEGKTFIDCEIIGPANVVLVTENNATENKLPHCDAIVLAPGDVPYNAIFLTSCTFRGCSFQRITFLISAAEYPSSQNVNWLHWIGYRSQEQFLPLINQGERPEPQSPPGIEARTQP